MSSGQPWGSAGGESPGATCRRCGAPLAPGARFCPTCGADQLDAGAPAPAPASALRFDPSRLSLGDRVAGIATLVLFIALFFPWYSVSVSSSSVGLAGSASTSALGSAAGGWRYLILILCLLILGDLAVRAVVSRPLQLPAPHWQVLGAALGLNALLTLLAFLLKPSVGVTTVPFSLNVSVSWSYGAFIGLIAALVALAGGVQLRREALGLPPIVRLGAAAGMPASSGSTAVAGGVPSGRAPAAPSSGAEPGAGAETGTVICPRCGAANPASADFCGSCGAPLRS